MNKEELLKMARDVGFGNYAYEAAYMFQDLANDILERAAVEFNQPHAEYFGHEIQETIRALKTQ